MISMLSFESSPASLSPLLLEIRDRTSSALSLTSSPDVADGRGVGTGVAVYSWRTGCTRGRLAPSNHQANSPLSFGLECCVAWRVTRALAPEP